MQAKIQKTAVAILTAVAIFFAAIGGAAVTAPTAAAAPTIVTPVATELFRPAPTKNNWAADTAKFAGCLGGFGFVATPVVVGFMVGGPGGAVSAARAWIPRLGPVGGAVLKWCMESVLGVRM